jgi:hypothetical protein
MGIEPNAFEIITIHSYISVLSFPFIFEHSLSDFKGQRRVFPSIMSSEVITDLEFFENVSQEVQDNIEVIRGFF